MMSPSPRPPLASSSLPPHCDEPAGVSSEVYIFLATGNRMKRVKWQKSGTFADLVAAHKKGESVEFSPAARI